MRRLWVAIAIAIGIYALAVGIGSIIYAAGWMPTGAAHNDCANYRQTIAEEQGIDEEDVAQEDIKQASIACLETHERDAEDVFKTYLFWSAWPAVITAAIFLAWPAWAAALHRQEQTETVADAPAHRTEPTP